MNDMEAEEHEELDELIGELRDDQRRTITR